MMFPGYDEMMNEIDPYADLPCLARSDWSTNALPPDLSRFVQERKIRLGNLRKEVIELS